MDSNQNLTKDSEKTNISQQEKQKKEVEVVLLGNKHFIIAETQNGLTFYDPSKKNEKLNIYGNMDLAVLKKGLTEHFENYYITPSLIDIKTDLEKKTGIQSNIEHYYGSEKNINNFLPQSIQQKMEDVKKQGYLTESHNSAFDRQIETARKTGYVQGVCECVAAIGDDHTLGKKLLTEMKVDKDMAKKFANPETYKALEKGIFAQKQDQKIEQTQEQSFKR